VGGERHTQGEMMVFTARQRVPFTALEPSIVMLLGGEPVGERYIEWNFVSSSRDRIEQAKADWRAGRMKLPDFDNGEFIPLPGDPPPPPNPMS
jgi:redox-sensitive bicupin YhaK (pirin superfamily)